ncbi:MAG: CYTH domain-containing protein [Patescibacteria group bacterium]
MPTANQFEVEVKTLLGGKKAADDFVAKLKQADGALQQTARSNQLNHYFDSDGDPDKVAKAVAKFLGEDDLAAFRRIIGQAKSYALRTRDADGRILLVIKAAAGGSRDGDDQHALERLEGEYGTTAPDIDTLDEAIRSAGYDFLSKWSRERIEYAYKDYTVCLDRNAGYGYLAEVEKIVPSSDEAETAREAILGELASLGFEELSQERVGRMFEHYNRHWPEYYKTEKTFTIE